MIIMKRYYLYLLSILIFVGCSKEQSEIANNNVNYSPNFYAEIDNTLARTYVSDALKVCWHENDKLSVFTSTANQLYQFDGNTGDLEGSFSVVEMNNSSAGSSLSINANYAVYPYQEETTILSDGTLTLNLPQNQVYTPSSFGINSNPMIAVTENKDDTYLSFKNICGYLKLSLYGDSITAKSIRLEGNSNERISGKANISISYGQEPIISLADDASHVITLDCQDGIQIGKSASKATEFWFVVPPITFENGFTIIIEDINGNKYTKSTESKLEIKRNVISNMAISKIEQLVYGYNFLTGDYLENWDAGYFDNNNCFIACRKESDGGYFAYIGQKDKLDDGITLKFDENLDIQMVFSKKGTLNVWEDESCQQKHATLILEDGIHVITFNQLNRAITRSSISASQALNIICNWVNNALTMNDVSSLFENGNDYLPTFISSTVLGTGFTITLNPVGGLGISLGLSYLEQKYEDDYYRLLNDYMGSPMVYISNIIDKNAPNYKIEVQIDGLNDMGKPLSTSIYTGIAVKMDESNVNYDNSDYKLKHHEVELNESHYDANIEVEKRRYYYLRPYTIVMVNGIVDIFPFTRNKFLWGGGQEYLISYGDVDKIFFDINATAITGDFITSTDKSAIVKCSYYKINGIEGIECGVRVVNPDTGKIMEILTNNSDGEREINISGLTAATTYTYNAYIKINDTIIKEGEIKTFTTAPEPLPDLTGWWTFNDAQGKDGGRVHRVEFYADGTTNAFYGINRLAWRVDGNKLKIIWNSGAGNTWWEYRGIFNDDFTLATGDAFYCVLNWVTGDYWERKSDYQFSLSR